MKRPRWRPPFVLRCIRQPEQPDTASWQMLCKSFFFFPQLIFAKLFNCPAFFAGCYYPRVAPCCHQQPARPRSAAWHWGRRWLEKASLIGRTPAQPWDSATAPSPRRPTSRHCQQPLIKLCSLGPDVTRLVPPLLEGVTALSACSISQALSPGRPGW